MKLLDRFYYPIKDFVLIFLGTLIFGLGFQGFIISNEIVTGGVGGICAVIFFATGFPVSVSYFLLNLILLIVAYKILGLKFLVKTIFGVISLSLSLSLFEFLLKGQPILVDEPFMSIVIGAILCGLSLGIIFSANGSTGGTDIIGAIVNKYHNISIARTLLFLDFLIIGSSYVLFHDISKIVFGFVEMVICNYVLDMVLNSNRQSVQFLIFSQKHDEIAEEILKNLGRGCTLLDGVGGYSQKPTKVIVLLAKAREAQIVFRLVKRIDSQAFISQSIVRGVYGEGFDQLKG